MKDRTKWKPSQIVNLLNICIEETHFYDDRGNIWTQTDGLAIGKSISGALTDIYMNWYEREYIFNPTQAKTSCFHFVGKDKKMMSIVYGNLGREITINSSNI